MKVVPVLVLTNALALGLVILLFVQQSDLEARLGSTRAGSTRRAELPADTAALQDRIARLEARLAAAGVRPESADEPGGAIKDPDTGAEKSPAEPDASSLLGGDELDPLLDMSAPEMESFRRRVRRAQELNSQEDRLRRVVDRLDRLVAQNRIAPLSDKQKAKVADVILASRRSIPDIWRKLRENNDLASMSREERGQAMRNEFDSLRIEAQKSLEEVMPGADAKTIIDDAMGGGMGGMFGRGDRGRSSRFGPGSRGR